MPACSRTSRRVAVAALAGLKWFTEMKAAARLGGDLAALQQKQQQLTVDAARLRALFGSGPLQVCNRSTGPLKVTSVMVMYLRASGERAYIHSGSFGYPEWTVNAGGRQRLDIIRGRADDWDGTAALYAIQVSYRGSEPFVVAGLWSDLRDGCVNLSLD